MMDSTCLEAYILRPQVHSIKDSSIIAYNTELLHLDDFSLQSHIAKLRPEYSIVDAMAELLPDQLRIIQDRTKFRQGGLLSVQFGREVDMVTQMGTFGVKSVVFVIKTAKEKEVNAGAKDAPVQKICAFPAPTSVPANAGIYKPGPSLFSNMSTSAFPPSASAGAGTNPINGANTQSNETEFRMNPPPQNMVDPTAGPVFYSEKDPSVPYAVQNYMSITFTDEHRDKSFEELRLADYKSGQTNDNNAKKLTTLFGQSTPVPKPPFEGVLASQSNQAGGFHGTTKGSAPLLARGLFGGPSGGFGSTYAPSSNQFVAPPVPAEAAPKEHHQARNAQEELGTSLSALALVPGVEARMSSENGEQRAAERKQKGKEKDFDPNHKTEYLWSARYDRLEARRIADAGEPPKEPDYIYTFDPNGVVLCKETSSATGPSTGFFGGKAPSNNLFSTLPATENAFSSGTASATNRGLLGGMTPKSNKFGSAPDIDKSLASAPGFGIVPGVKRFIYFGDSKGADQKDKNE
jgi:hypothetical protein